MRREIYETIKLSFPIMIAQLGVILMGVTDNLMVGRFLGAIPLGAAGLANSLSFLFSSVGVGGLTVVSALISQAKGKGDNVEIGNIFRSGIRVAILLGIVLGGISAIVGYTLDIFGQTADITRMAKPFMYILSISTIPLLLFVAIRQLADGLSFTRIAMGVTLTALVVNALFNWLLINGIWIFPKLGLNGSATATLIARIYMAVAIWFYISQGQQFKQYLKAVKNVATNNLDYKILQLSLPVGFQFFFEIAAFSLAVVMIGWLGENQLAAHQIAINLASTTYMMATGIAAAGAIRVGHAYGEANFQKVKDVGSAALIVVAVFMGFWAIVFLGANEFLVSLYLKNDPEVMKIAAILVVYAAVFQLSDGIQAVGMGILRGLTDVNMPTIIALVAYWVIALPLGYFLAFSQKLDVEGVWMALSIGLTFSAVFLTIRFYTLIRKHSYSLNP